MNAQRPFVRWLSSPSPKRSSRTARKTIALLYARGMRQAVLDASAKIAEALVVGGQTGYREKFFLYGFVGIYDEWLERGFAETPEEVAAMLGGFDDLISRVPQ